MGDIRSISVRQPYATLIMMGLKQIETKTTTTHFRGTILIHASATMGRKEKEIAKREGFDLDQLPRGAILGSVRIVDSTPVESLQVDATEKSVGDYSRGRWGWRLENPRPLAEPVKCLGALSFWRPTEETLAKVAEQIELPARVFVYGTLKRGHGNHRLLKSAAFIGERSVLGTMHDLGAFPAVCLDGSGWSVFGELYEVDRQTLRNLDGLEGCPSFYQRTRVSIYEGGEAWIYTQEKNRLRRCPTVRSGRWER